MTTAIEHAARAPRVTVPAGWKIPGRAAIDHRPAASCWLTIKADGTWGADLAMFTFADTVDLMFESDAGGHFCGPAFVERSGAHSDPFAASTTLTGIGPLLVVDPATMKPELPAANEFVDGEVVD